MKQLENKIEGMKNSIKYVSNKESKKLLKLEIETLEILLYNQNKNLGGITNV